MWLEVAFEWLKLKGTTRAKLVVFSRLLRILAFSWNYNMREAQIFSQHRKLHIAIEKRVEPQNFAETRLYLYNVQMDAPVLGDRLPEGTQKPLLSPGRVLFAMPALRELESACRVSIL